MNENLRKAIIAAVIALVVVPVLAIIFIQGISFSVLVVLEIAVVAFFTIVFVMIIGSQEDHYPKSAADSPAVTKWSQREAQKQEQRVENNMSDFEGSSAQA